MSNSCLKLTSFLFLDLSSYAFDNQQSYVLYPTYYYGNANCTRKNFNKIYSEKVFTIQRKSTCSVIEGRLRFTQKSNTDSNFSKKGLLLKSDCNAAPEINIRPVPDIVSGSLHFVPVTRNSCRSSVYDILSKFENLPVIVTDRKRILSVTHEIVPDSDR